MRRLRLDELRDLLRAVDGYAACPCQCQFRNDHRARIEPLIPVLRDTVHREEIRADLRLIHSEPRGNA